jgi:very-short-patch-repair endonuclease
MKTCNFCGREFETGWQLGGHKGSCKKNPNHEKKRENIAKSCIGKHLSESHKKNISIARIRFLKANPDKVPYKINHNSHGSFWEEIFENALKLHNVKGWIKKYTKGIYEYDFAFPLQKLDVEIDGYTHELEKVIKIDERRDKWTKEQGWEILRFKASYVKRDIESCIRILLQKLNNLSFNANNEIENEFAFIRKQSDRKLARLKVLKQIRFEKREAEKKERTKLFFTANIDLTKFGWICKISKLWKISHTHVRRIMKKEFPEEYKKAFHNKAMKKF